MSNLKLTGHNWATDGIYDVTQGKDQKTINAELYAASGSAITLTSTASDIKMDGTRSAGTSTKGARADHVHASDTSRAPTSHASSATTYGSGTDANYGHVKLSDAVNSSTAAASGGTAATPKAVKTAYDLANGKPSLEDTTVPVINGTAAVGSATTASRSDHVHPVDSSRAPKSHAATGTTYGAGTDTKYGHVKLSDATDGTAAASSGGTAATPAAVKAAYDLANGKQSKNIYVTSKSVAASAWASNTTYSSAGFTYRASIAITGVTSSMFAQVVFAPADALSGNYCPVCKTYNGGVYIYSSVNTAITIATIAVFP